MESFGGRIVEKDTIGGSVVTATDDPAIATDAVYVRWFNQWLDRKTKFLH